MIVKIKNKENITNEVFALEFEYEGKILPGNFVSILIPNSDIILRRPFSIAKYENNTITLIIKKLGIGTKYLSELQAGNEIDVLLPLGKGFEESIENEKTLFIAGGIGVAGISTFINRKKDYKFLFGDKEGEYKKVLEYLNLQCDYIKENEKGFVTEFINKYDFQTIIACGPFAMFKSVKEKINNKRFLIIAEQIMACGIGLCNGCTIEMTDNTFQKVCKDGPVFNGMRVKYD